MASWVKLLMTGDSTVTFGVVASVASLGAGTSAAAGTANTAARTDHKHGIITGSTASVVAAGAAAASGGVKTGLARIDHVHLINYGSTGSMVAGLNRTANAKGSSYKAARIDHGHTISLKMNSVATAGAKFQLYKGCFEILATAPSIGTGRAYFHVADEHIYVYCP